ncbi:ATP-dependent DNA helicase DinG [Ureibacillus terrenus]|uniref:ATP-dependent DNA helicase DinG n=1 Tax=Ureibacillus terrenus TaxID=118246 RepID=UPI002E1E4106|nr:ATP-dependent DNA helicase DinG [Ureibacillus terrenus]
MEHQKYVIVDLETTGHSPKEGDRIIQISMVTMKNWEVKDTFTTFVHPGRSIPVFIQDLTNISDQDIQDALPFEHYSEQIYSILQDAIFVAHNVDFDLSFLQAEFERAGLPEWRGKKIDTVELSKILFPMAIGYKLADLASDLNIPLVHAHRADDDAMATALLLKKCWKEILALPVQTIEQLHKYSFKLKSNISHLFFQALQIKRKNLGEESFIVYHQFAFKKDLPISLQHGPIRSFPNTDEEKMELLSKQFPNFEKRPCQFQMMDAIWETLQRKSEIMIEASTGVGKTLGYLLPSFIYAKQQGKKICISTYTSFLLEQILYKEIPKIEQVLGTKIRVALLKGMQNYIDIELFEQLLKQEEHTYDETLTILQILVWLSKTDTGDLSELNLSGGGQLFIDKIRKKRRNNNPFDFYERAIEKSKKADIIVTNHAMLLSDLERLEPVFHSIEGWIIDEAHQFVQAAINRNQVVFSYARWKYQLGQMGITSDNGLFKSIQKAALKSERISKRQFVRLEKCYLTFLDCFDRAMQTLIVAIQVQKRPQLDYKQTAFLKDLSLDRNAMKEVSSALQNWIDLAEELSDRFLEAKELSAENKMLLERWDYWIREWKVKLAEWDSIFFEANDHYSIWIELDRRHIPGSIRIYKKPLEITEAIDRLFQLFRQKAGIIWTSGTLTIPGNERFVAKQLGIGNHVPVLKLEAPQNYYSGAKVYIATDMPDIQAVPQAEYIEAVAGAVSLIVQSTGGRCFVLFNSQDMLKRTAELIEEADLLNDYLLFAQGVTSGSRMKLLKAFKKFQRSVLFGTNSFWEGVDVPGEDLNTVIIVRLPFSSPDEPIFKAKADKLKEKGKNAFTDLSLPEAVLRFKQGFGRLIRSSKDHGALIVLDRRIETKSYGKEFIQALPDIKIEKLPLLDMVKDLQHWYNN